MKSTSTYQVWAYGKTYSAQSKTKVAEKVKRDWSYWPSALRITKHRNGKLVELIDPIK